MNLWVYSSSKSFVRFARRQCLDCKSLNLDRLNQCQSYILACTHISHLEPFLLSSLVDQPIRWVARTEMFRIAPVAKLFHQLGSIPIRRNYPSVRAIHQSIYALKQNRIVGIFPEGEVKHGKAGIIRGGSYKQGVILIAQRANVPIIPVVMLGTEKLNAVEPWYPGSRYPLWVGVGNPVDPDPDYLQASIARRKIIRRHQAGLLGSAFVSTYREMLQTYNLDDHKVP